ncbi:DDE Tnp4 domain-containing protein [Mycena venus]|uniref:DDE Tnp4 domain-containing protein n=1 Tax=Mycena venus TaxID=2733690 RepID=A0A8H6XT11_9AGAR|nr:DDE Tnp4 domain-containing protein [Mycena venus]
MTFPLMRWGLKKLLLTILLPSLNDGDNLFSVLQEPPSPTAIYAGVAANLEEASRHAEPERARPEQGGERITTAWLYTLKPRDILYRFRFYAAEIEDLVCALDIPDPFKTDNRYCFSAIEALCLLLARFKSCEDMYDLSMKYDRSQSSISEVVNKLVIWLDNRWKNLLDFDTDGVLSPDNLAIQ